MIILTLDMTWEQTSPVKPGRALLGGFFIALLIKLFLFDLMIVEGHSMLPTLQPGSVLILEKIAYGLRLPWTNQYLFWWSSPKPGDVVVFYTPQGAVAVKRCADITGEDTFIALGDNPLESYDSRSYGPVPISNIIGKVVGI